MPVLAYVFFEIVTHPDWDEAFLGSDDFGGNDSAFWVKVVFAFGFGDAVKDVRMLAVLEVEHIDCCGGDFNRSEASVAGIEYPCLHF